VSWAFLADIDRHHLVRPWLILDRRRSPLGETAFAVPRLAPESQWEDHADYRQWIRATWRGDLAPIPHVITIDDATARLPAQRGRPKWSQPDRLVWLALRSGLDGLSSSEIAVRASPDTKAREPERTVRDQVTRARAFLAAVNALPWAAFEDGRLPRESPWWQDQRFADALAGWRTDAANLSWRLRYGQDSILVHNLDRNAANVFRRTAWSDESDPVLLAHARGVLTKSAREFAGPVDEWLEYLIAAPYQTPECRRDLVRGADDDGWGPVLREIWRFTRDGS
jgi:hypothetical protein